MAIHFVHVNHITRSKGHSAVSASAYRSGEKLKDKDGIEYDYSNKKGIDHTGILLPEGAPKELQDRGELWRSAEAVEGRIDSRVAKSVIFALPKELDKKAQIELVENYSKNTFVSRNIAVDYAIHGTGTDNPHAHLLMSTRKLSAEGFDKYKANNLNSKQATRELLHKEWSNHVNDSLERYGSKERIDSRSYQERGLETEPEKHIKNPELRKATNDKIKARNLEREREAPKQEQEREKEQDKTLDERIQKTLEYEQKKANVIDEINRAEIASISTESKEISEEEKRMRKLEEDFEKARERARETRERTRQQAQERKLAIEKLNESEIANINAESKEMSEEERIRKLEEDFEKARERSREARERSRERGGMER